MVTSAFCSTSSARRGISEDPPGDAQERVTDLVHQIGERFLIAGAGSLHHISLQETLRTVVTRPPSTHDEVVTRENVQSDPGWIGLE